MRFGSFVLAFFSLLVPALSQQLAVGVKGGIRASNDLSELSYGGSESRRYIIGPMLDLRLPWRLGVEFDALYRSFGYTSWSNQPCCASAIHRGRANSWEFPIIIKYRLPVRLVHPFAGVGYDPRTVHGSEVSSGGFLSGMTSNPPGNIWTYYFNERTSKDYPVAHGYVISGGVDLDAKHIRISPELRYVHWNRPFLGEWGGDGSYYMQSAQSEFFILVGISWH